MLLVGCGLWWAPSPPKREASVAAPPPVIAVQPPPEALPPLAGEAEILADHPAALAVYRFAPDPAIVVLQFPSLDEQALALNRVAALVEKAGFPHDAVLPRPTLDARIIAAGGQPSSFYYGHDYSAASLARFFDLASDLDPQEAALRVLARRLGWQGAGASGALISFASAPALDPPARATVLRHELSHGFFFTDPAFAAFSRHFWNDVLTVAERARFTDFLAREGYDTTMPELVINETQAYLVHTPDKRYFNASAVGIPPSRIAELRGAFIAGMPPGWLRDTDRAQ